MRWLYVRELFRTRSGAYPRYAPASLLATMFAKSQIANNLVILKLPYSEVYSGLASLDRSLPDTLLKRYAVVSVIAFDYQLPEGLGAYSAKTCYKFTGPGKTETRVAELFVKANKTAINGLQTWTWEGPPYEGHPKTTKFFAMERHSGFLMCNDRGAYANYSHKSLINDPPSDKPAYKLCRRAEGSSDLGGSIPVSGINQICLEEDGLGSSAILLRSSKGATESTATFVKDNLNLSSDGTKAGIQSERWQLPSSGEPFAGELWFRIMQYLGFGVVV